MQLISLIIALFASVVLCFLPKWLVIGLIVIFVLVSAVFLGTSTAWMVNKPGHAAGRELYKHLTDELRNDNEPLSITGDCFANRLLVSRNVDPIIKDIITRILEDHLFNVFKDITGTSDEDVELICTRLVNETWVIVSRIRDRLLVIDQVKLLTKDLIERITKHFNKINTSHTRGSKYTIPPYLSSDEMEKDYLRRVADVLLHAFLPRSYMAFNAFRHLLREILAIQVLFRTLTLFSDSDFLNRQILRQIHAYQVEKQKKPVKLNATYVYAANFDQFVQVIKETFDIDQLNEMRYIILNEIMQATFIQNLKKEGQLANHNHNQLVSWPHIKRQDLLSRDLATYTRQLKQSLDMCEQKIKTFSADEKTDKRDATVQGKKKSRTGYLPRKKIHPFMVVMTDPVSRELFYKYLQETLSKSSSNLADSSVYHLVEFWNLVAQMKLAGDSKKSIAIANDILAHSYFLASIQSQIEIPRDVTRAMESFILGEGSPDAFNRTQTVVFKLLEERYYPKFVTSREYDQLLANPAFPSIDVEAMHRTYRHRRSESAVSISSSMESINSTRKTPTALEEHVRRARIILTNLQEAHRKKCDALAVLKQGFDFETPSIDSTGKLIKRLESEISQIECDILTAEVHLNRTSLWVKNLSSWRAQLYSIQPAENDSAVLAIIVQPDEANSGLGCDAWVIARSVNELITLKKKLIKVKPSLKNIVIYRLRSFKDKSVKDELIEEAKKRVQMFFDEIFTDISCLQSEDVFLFFISSPPHLREPLSKPSIKKSFLPLANLFGINSQSNSDLRRVDEDKEIEEINDLYDEFESENSLKDNIAEPALALIATVFDLQGNTSWLRQYMIALVQITYRKTINKQIRETVTWLLSESMVSMYLSQFRDTLWPPNGTPDPLPTFEELKGDKLYSITKMKMVQNMPEMLVGLFGEVTAKQGAVKVLEAMQQQTLNKALLHDMLEVILIALVPEVTHPMPHMPSFH